MKIVDEFKRAGLIEGRNRGMGFALARKVSPSEFHTTMAISPCKDYLNDALFAEAIGEIIPPIYGFKYKKIHNIIETDYFYLVSGFFTSNKADGLQHIPERVAKNYRHTEKLINEIEKELGSPNLTRIIRVENHFLIEAPVIWAKYIYMLSLYTLLIRAFQSYKGSDNHLDYLYNGEVEAMDNGLMLKARKKIPTLLEKKDLPVQSLEAFIPVYSKGYSDCIHTRAGIISFNF